MRKRFPAVAGMGSEDPYGTAHDVARADSPGGPSVTGFWTEQKAKAELRRLAGGVFLPREYGRELDPTHPMTAFLKSFRSGSP